MTGVDEREGSRGEATVKATISTIRLQLRWKFSVEAIQFYLQKRSQIYITIEPSGRWNWAHFLVIMALTTTGGDASTFRQQGTMDWVALAQKPVQFSFNVLARYSKAGIDPLTVAAGQAACSSLQIPWKTQQEILERMSKLPCLALYGNVAWFGFGLKHALCDLTDRDGGLECLTICGCLAESFSTFYGAQVLHAFCRHQNMPSALLPGIRNWHTLIKPCAGIFAGSKFSNLIHGFACLLVPPSSSGIGLYEATAPDALAQALIRLIEVSNKHLENITIIGGIDCAWLAAFAEFVLGLRIEILTCDGAQEYCSNSKHVSTSVKIQVTFLKDGAAKPEVEITRKSFILPVGQDLFKLQQEINKPSQNQINHIRSPWTSILIDSFGKSAQLLLHDPVISGYFGKILVYASKENTKTYFKSPRCKKEIVYIKMQYCAFSRRGDDLLDFAAWRFPELKPVLQGATANREHRITLHLADEAVQGLEVACKCCHLGKIHFRDKTYCLLCVTSSIVKMISILSMTNVLDMNPIASGVQAFYRNESTRYPSYLHADAQDVTPIDTPLRSAVHMLFSPPMTMRDHTTMSPRAVAEGGICSFVGLLTDPKLPPISAGTVTVMPGHIEYQGCWFEKIEDMPLRPDPIPADLTSFELESKRTFDLLISETADLTTLQAAYRSQDNSPGIPCHFNVGTIIEELDRSDHSMQKSRDGRMIIGIDHEESCVNQGNSKPWIRKGELCLMIAFLIGKIDKPYLEIHKTSSDFSDPANAHQLYSKYQRLKEHVSDDDVLVGFTYVGDCPACVFQCFHRFKSRRSWQMENMNYFRCCVTIHRSGKAPHVNKFESEVRDSHDRSNIKGRVSDVGWLMMQSPMHESTCIISHHNMLAWVLNRSHELLISSKN